MIMNHNVFNMLEMFVLTVKLINQYLYMYFFWCLLIQFFFTISVLLSKISEFLIFTSNNLNSVCLCVYIYTSWVDYIERAALNSEIYCVIFIKLFNTSLLNKSITFFQKHRTDSKLLIINIKTMNSNNTFRWF